MRKYLIPFLLLIGAVVIVYFSFFNSPKEKQAKEVFFTVTQGSFPITVTATGELDSKKSVKIRGPQGMRAAKIFETTITDLATEGTILKKGDYVGTLDRTELANRMGTIQVEIDRIQTQLDQAKIDTAIELRGLRDQMINTQYALKEKKLQVDLNRFEAKSIIRQTQLDLEKSERDLSQLKEQYTLKQQQSVAKVKEILSLLKKNQLEMGQLQTVSDGFTITAPSDGMLIYSREWGGKKEPGSRVSAWNPVVAELPDLTDMISKIYVNEVDISKVTKGQDVSIKIDAFPDLDYTGSVIQVANIGEQVRGYDTKVFEVIVQVYETDSIMRPAMTTSNEILTSEFDEVISVPLEALYSDSINYVFVQDGKQLIQKEVIPSLSNNDAIIIEHGLEVGEKVLLSLVDKTKEYPFQAIDPAIKNKIEQKLKAAMAKRRSDAKKKAAMVQDVEVSTNSGSVGGDFIIIN